ncbi:hypothetical protein Tco_0123815 [Tanacetum coccineum]
MEIPDTMIDDAFKKSAGYKYYKAKKAESEKAKVAEKPEEQYVSPMKSGRGKGYIRLGDQEVNVPSAFKKNVVPRKTRSLTIVDNIVEELVVVELVKSISCEDRHCQQHEIITQLTSNRQIEKMLKTRSKASRLESLKQAKQAVAGKGSSAAHNKYHEFENISATDTEATQDSSRSNTDEEKDVEIDDSDDSKMDLSKDKPKRDGDAVGFGVFTLLNDPHANKFTDFMSNLVYTDAHITSVVIYPEGNPKLTSYISCASEVPLAKKIKEIIQKDELIIADLEGTGLEKLKLHYKNDVELEYHVDPLKEAVLSKAQ